MMIYLDYGASGFRSCGQFKFHQFSKNISWPQQLPTESISDIIEKLDFWWSITQKREIIGHFVRRDDPAIGIWKFFDEIDKAVEIGETNEVAEILWPGKSPQRTSKTHPGQVLEFSFILMFGNKNILGRIIKYHIEF